MFIMIWVMIINSVGGVIFIKWVKCVMVFRIIGLSKIVVGR